MSELKELPRYNETFIEVLEKLASLMSKRGDYIRNRVYTRAQDTIRNITTDITSVDQLKGKPNIGPTILEKLNEYVTTGTLGLFEREKDNPEFLLSEVYGIGPIKAKELVKQGITTIPQLRERQDEVLNNVQKAGLKYYEDILERIPRTEIDEYNELFKTTFNKVIDNTIHSHYEIVGSYRRGAQTSGDIDVIITSPNSDTFIKFINAMKESGIILELLSYGKTKCLVIAKLPNHITARRVDFLYTSQEEYPFAILYFTGSKTFNTVMRGHALKLGFSLNEHGLYKKQTGKVKEEKVDAEFKTEQDIFDYLKLEYKNPIDRIDGRSVVIKSGENVNFIKETNILKEKKEPKTRKIKEPKEPKVKKEPKTRKNKEQPILSSQPELTNIPIIPIVRKKRTLKIKEAPIPIVPVIPQVMPQIIPQVLPQIESTTTILPIKAPRKKRTLKIRPTEQKIEKVQEQKINNININPVSNLDTNTPTMNNIIALKNKGITVLENLNEKQLSDMIILANDTYYNTKTALMTDNEFDIIKEFIEKKYPKNEAITHIGAPVGKNKVKLPYHMPSMDKIKPDTNALSSWMKTYKGPYVLSCKLDGVSGMYSTEGDTPKLYTRGDGIIGQDISHLLPILYETIKLPKEKGYVVRGEFILPKTLFNNKYKTLFANPRNLVSGIINSKSTDDKTRDLHFVVYEVIQPQMKPSNQFSKLKDLGFEVVRNRIEPILSNELLSETLVDWRTNYDYEIDGVIVSDDNIHERADINKPIDNPEYAFAFKMVMSDQLAEAKVVDVIWNPSKNGYLKPRVRIEPIKLGGVTIEYATGFNGKFIEENKIGIGSVIQIVRSGDVIPIIKSVTTPAEKAKMPDVPYHWTDTHIDIIIDNVSEDITVIEKNITAFFTGLEIDGLSTGNVKRLMKSGYNTVPKILKMNKTDFIKVEGFQQKMVDKIHDGIKDKVKKASLLDIMVASNALGRGLGERKMKPIMEMYPDILTSTESPEDKMIMLRKVPGIGNENAKSFIENIPVFLQFLKDCDLEYKLLNSTDDVADKTIQNAMNIDTTNPLYGKHIVMTKVRDQKIIDELKRVGGILDDAINKSTFVLIVKTKDDVSNKTKYANEHNIPIMTPNEFINKFMV